MGPNARIEAPPYQPQPLVKAASAPVARRSEGRSYIASSAGTTSLDRQAGLAYDWAIHSPRAMNDIDVAEVADSAWALPATYFTAPRLKRAAARAVGERLTARALNRRVTSITGLDACPNAGGRVLDFGSRIRMRGGDCKQWSCARCGPRLVMQWTVCIEREIFGQRDFVYIRTGLKAGKLASHLASRIREENAFARKLSYLDEANCEHTLLVAPVRFPGSDRLSVLRARELIEAALEQQRLLPGRRVSGINYAARSAQLSPSSTEVERIMETVEKRDSSQRAPARLVGFISLRRLRSARTAAIAAGLGFHIVEGRRYEFLVLDSSGSEVAAEIVIEFLRTHCGLLDPADMAARRAERALQRQLARDAVPPDGEPAHAYEAA